MSPRALFILLAALLLARPAFTHAEPAPSPSANQVVVEIQSHFLYATNAQMEAAFRAEPSLSKKSSPLSTVLSPAQFAAVREALKKSGAVFFSDPRLICNNGTRSAVNSEREMRYPTEYQRVGEKFIPTAFETRNVGVNLEVEATALGESIDLNLVPTVTTFLGFIDYASGKGGKTEHATGAGESSMDTLLKSPLKSGGLWQPVFSTFKVNTPLTIHDGQTVLLGGTMKAEETPIAAGQPGAPIPAPKVSDQRVFIFITASLVPQH